MHDTPALSGVFIPVTAVTTFEETVARLGTAIRLGLLAPGTRLPPERDLADQLAISRSTLRQALKLLTESGHLVSLRGRTGGTFVSEAPPAVASGAFDDDDESWRDFFDLRLAVELGAVLLASERASAGDLARMERHSAAMADGTEWIDRRRADAFFHLTIAESTGSAGLLAKMTEIHGTLNELLKRLPHPPSATREATAEHAAIIEALRERDASRAVGLMRAHLDHLSQVVGTILLASGRPA